jgi:hypothetical protein
MKRKLWGAHGPIPVHTKKNLRDEKGQPCHGMYLPDERVIVISGDIQDARLREVTLEHEWLHSVLCDAGGQDIIDDDKHEWFCSVVSAALVAARRQQK